MARHWYAYIVPNSDPRLSSNYQLIKNGGPTCISGNQLCAIYSPEGGLFPFSPLSQNLQDYIAAALATGIAQPDFPEGSKFFVYLKG